MIDEMVGISEVITGFTISDKSGKYTPFHPFLEKSGNVWKSLEFRT